MKKSIFRTLVAALLVLVLSVSAVAWFMESEQISPEVQGSAMTGYFHAGDGSIDHPYELENPKHVYNLAWLQYMGYLNEIDPNTGKINQTYFKLNRDIDMTGIILPPIGTTEFPFVGHFDGQGNCIRNLTVSNYLFGENDSFKIVQRPLSVTEIDGESVSIIGFFGVVGAMDDDLAALLADDSKVEKITDKVNAIHDLFLEDLTVRTETSSSLIGLVAGYANGSIVNVGVAGNSDIQLGSTTQPLQPEEVADITYEVSFYSLIGQYNATNIVWKDKPTGGLVDGGGAQGAGWGGSINMNQLRLRIAYIAKAVGLKYNSGVYKGVGFGFTGSFGASQTNYIEGTYLGPASTYVSLESGTVMPLSIDQKTFSPSYYTGENTTEEDVVESNSGYIIGGGTRNRTNNAYVNFVADYIAGGGKYTGTSLTAGISKSVGNAIDSSVVFPQTNFHMLTISVTDEKTYAISDEYNSNADTWIGANYSSSLKSYNELGLKKYGGENGVRNVFVSSTVGSNYIHTIKFASKIDINNNLANLEKVAVNDVMLFGNTYNGYEMVVGAINFSLKEIGVATTIVSTNSAYGTDIGSLPANAHSLFRILEIKRDSKHKIISVTPIDTIHEEINGSGKVERYLYNMTESDKVSGCTYNLVFDYAKMGSLSEVGAAYYFEFPLNAGDYAIGSTTDVPSTYTANLLYLDIGANGDKTLGEDDDGSTGTKTAYHQIEGVTFVDSDAVAAKSTSGYSVVTFKVAISEGGYGKSHGGLTVSFNRSSKVAMTVTETDSTNAFGVTDVEDDDDLTVTVGLPPSS